MPGVGAALHAYRRTDGSGHVAARCGSQLSVREVQTLGQGIVGDVCRADHRDGRDMEKLDEHITADRHGARDDRRMAEESTAYPATVAHIRAVLGDI